MKAPFPWFGGKAKIAEEVWRRFGDVPNYWSRHRMATTTRSRWDAAVISREEASSE